MVKIVTDKFVNVVVVLEVVVKVSESTKFVDVMEVMIVVKEMV